MTACFRMSIGQWLRVILLMVPGLIAAIATSVAAPSPYASAIEQFHSEQELAAYHPSNSVPLAKSPAAIYGQEANGRVDEARRILKELQLFIEATARTVELDSHLKLKKRENDQLKQALSSSRLANSQLENEVRPMEQAQSALTRHVVRNWLEAVQLKYRVDEANRELSMSEDSWSDVEGRAAVLRRELITRRAEIQQLRRMTSALNDELDNTRRQVKQAQKTARQLERQRDLIIEASKALRRDVASKLRNALLKTGY